MGVLQLTSICLLATFAISFLYLLILELRNLVYSSKLPPGPHRLPIIGNLPHLGSNPHQTLARLAKTYGPLMTLHLGHVITIVVSSPDMAREVLQTNDQVFANRWVADALRALGHSDNSVAWVPVSTLWKELRRICNTELFTARRLDASAALRASKVNDLLDYVNQCCAAERSVNIGDAAFTAMLNVLSNSIFSTDFVTAGSASSQVFREAVLKLMEEAGLPNLSDCFPWLRILDLQGRRRNFGSHLAKLHSVFDEQIDRRLQAMKEGAPSGDDFLGVFIQYQREKDSSEVDPQTMKPLLTDLFIAGSDTSSNTVEWSMTELLRNPKSMVKLREEIRTVIGLDRPITESDINRLPYLQAVVKETLRLHPPVPFLIPRKPEKTVDLGGYKVPRGSRVFVNVWAIQRDPEVWQEPERFAPERFLQGMPAVDLKGSSLELIPFGAGRRICPGLPLAQRMVHIMLASLVQRFDWQLPFGMSPEDIDISERFGITLAKAVPFEAIPIKAFSQ